jgi:hypothetical protein
LFLILKPLKNAMPGVFVGFENPLATARDSIEPRAQARGKN